MLSNVKFAKLVGCSETTVRRARQEGALYIEPDGTIDPEHKQNKTWAQVIVCNVQVGQNRKDGSSKKKTKLKKKDVSKKAGRSTKKASAPEVNVEFLEDAEDLSIVAQLKVLKEKEIIREKRIKNQKLRGELVSKNEVSRVFNKLWSVDSSQLVPLAAKIAPEVCSICGVADPELVTKVTEKIDKEIWRTLAHCKRLMVEYLENIDAETLKEG